MDMGMDGRKEKSTRILCVSTPEPYVYAYQKNESVYQHTEFAHLLQQFRYDLRHLLHPVLLEHGTCQRTMHLLQLVDRVSESRLPSQQEHEERLQRGVSESLDDWG